MNCTYFSLAGVAEGLSHMHSRQILHNDLKADNVAISSCLPECKETVKLWPMIIDFSKACPTNKGKKYTLEPHEREAFKRRYTQLAPDLVDGIVEQSYLSDVFSFGEVIKKMARSNRSKSLEQLASQATAYSCSDRQQLSETISALKALL